MVSINFDKDTDETTQSFIREFFGDRSQAQDARTTLLHETQFDQFAMKAIANKAKQPAVVELHSIGDRKEVGGVVYELEEAGWKRLPIGTKIDD